MTSRWLSFAALLLLATPAHADDTTGGSSGEVFWVEHVQHGAGQAKPDSGGRPAASDGPYLTIGESACAGAATVADSDLVGASEVSLCAESHTTTIRTIDLGMIQRAFAELQLPASTLVIQPPDGLTLVNFLTP